MAFLTKVGKSQQGQDHETGIKLCQSKIIYSTKKEASVLRKTLGTERKRFLSNDNKKNSWSLLFQEKIFYSKFVSSFTIVRVKSTISSLSSCPLFQDSFTNLMVVSSSLFYELNLLFLVFFQVHCTQNLLFQGCFKFTILE